NGTPIEFADRNTDGNDVLFGDLGNDWIVGGTGKDTSWGGWGIDLLNADDVLGTTGDTDEATDTHPIYEDRAYGGASYDILIANTGGDRLIHWVGGVHHNHLPVPPVGHRPVTPPV